MPQEAIDLENAFESVPGVTCAYVGRHQFSKQSVEDLNKISFSGQFADLPIAMLRRSNGTLENEFLIFVEYEIEFEPKGLKALEFLSWWVRDLSRSGENVQIRSIGLPQIEENDGKFGNTLKFWFEAYLQTETADMKLVLSRVSDFTNSLNTFSKLYDFSV